MTAPTLNKEITSARELVTRAEAMHRAVRSDPDVPLSVVGGARLLAAVTVLLLEFTEKLEQLSEDVKALSQKSGSQ